MTQKVSRVLERLQASYPDARTELHYNTAFQLLVATILSAQCTDVRVNMVTPRLFERFPDAFAMARASIPMIELLIRDCGLFHTKARNIYNTSRLLVERWDGQVPESRDVLMTLPGVGRKTANVVVANAFGQDALAVDTHVFRVAHRLGWSKAKDPDGTERDLMRIIPKKKWSSAHHWLILHGRRVCTAKKPRCADCVLFADCPRVGVLVYAVTPQVMP